MNYVDYNATFPELHIHDEVEWAPNPDCNDRQWERAVIMMLKNNGCDVARFNQMGLVYQHDCIHISDERCHSTTTRDWQDPARGVFRLSKREMQWRDMMRLVPELQNTVRHLRIQIEQMVVELEQVKIT